MSRTQSSELWTIGELSEHVAAALRAHAERPPIERRNGRVRAVPDARTIRWYQTTGMVDRPVAMRGRTALYGRRHLLQLLAIKRLQERGHSLADIQARLAGAPERALAALAGEPPVPGDASVAPGPVAPTSATEVAAHDAASGSPPGHRSRFWAAIPGEPAAEADHPGPVSDAAGADQPGTSPTGREVVNPEVVNMAGVRLDADLTVVINDPGRPLTADDLAALRAAAAPLVRVIRQRGITRTAPDVTAARGKDNP